MPNSRYSFMLTASIVAIHLTACDSSVTPTDEPAPQRHQVDVSDKAALSSSSEVASQAVPLNASQPQENAPLEIAKRVGCLNCHRIDTKLVGPPWRDVARRYASDPAAKERLVKKVREGGSGNWTDLTGGAVMPPYGGRVAAEDISTLVTFILGLAEKN